MKNEFFFGARINDAGSVEVVWGNDGVPTEYVISVLQALLTKHKRQYQAAFDKSLDK